MSGTFSATKKTGVDKKKEGTPWGYLLVNLNLIVDRPDGLIMEG